MEFVALTTRQLDYLARQDPYLEPIFKGVFASADRVSGVLLHIKIVLTGRIVHMIFFYRT